MSSISKLFKFGLIYMLKSYIVAAWLRAQSSTRLERYLLPNSTGILSPKFNFEHSFSVIAKQKPQNVLDNSLEKSITLNTNDVKAFIFFG